MGMRNRLEFILHYNVKNYYHSSTRLFFCGLFDGAVSNSDTVASNCGTPND